MDKISFCFTGEFDTITREKAENIAHDAGHTVNHCVIHGVDYLVTNKKGTVTAKQAKAAALGIKTISEKEFIKICSKP